MFKHRIPPAPFALVPCLAAVALSAVLASRADATVPSDLCTGNPCVVTQVLTVDAGSELDFGAATALRLAPSARLTVGPGASRDVTLTAGSIALEPGAAILGGGDEATVELVALGGDVDVQRSGATIGRVELSGLVGGSLTISASGAIVVAGDLDVRGTGRDAEGGSIGLDATDVTVPGGLLASASGNGAVGGGIAIFATGSITTTGTVTASGGSFGAGEIVFDAEAGGVHVAGTIGASGGNPDASGGLVEILAPAGDVIFTATVTGTGGTGAQEACGDGANVTLDAGRDVTLGGAIDLSSGTHCIGGELAVFAGRDVRQQAGATFRSRGPGAFGGGGRLDVEAGESIVLRHADLTSNGTGGDLVARAPSSVEIRGTIDASASGVDGLGGTTLVRSCHVLVGAAGVLDTRGAFVLEDAGFNRLQASGAMTVNGTLRAASGNFLEHKGIAPVVTGTVAPAPTIGFVATLPDCPPVPECGNGVSDAGEACDDGNTESCDGCSADCLRVDATCGDGEQECGEQCDDGNVVDGDGCEASCLLTPTEGVRVRGTPLEAAGCIAQWSLGVPDPATNPGNGLPASRQACADGDPACDADGQADGVCTFDVRVCLRVPDPAVPACTSPAVKMVKVLRPTPAQDGDAVDQANAAALTDALLALGGTVNVGGTKVQSGSPIAGADTCTAAFSLQVPHLPGAPGERSFNIAARGNASKVMRKNQLELVCETHAPICGDGILQSGEACEDGDTAACDGCSASCGVEQCGNGVVDCGEECDEGDANGGPEAACSASCERLTPELRIPGSGAARFDCALEWSALAGDDDVPLDSAAIPRNSITCTDNDPACDLDPQVSRCRMRLWACFGGADERLACPAHTVLGATVRAPTATVKKAPEVAARAALLDAIDAFPFPSGPGERCTQPIEVDVPARQAWLELKLEAEIGGARYEDRDALRLRCRR